MLYTNITTIPKQGSEKVLTNQRGIFRISVLRYILMKLIYKSEYETIDSNMSESNIGGRKGKGCRNHLFIINGIIHDVLSSVRKHPILIQIYDYKQMFDAINLEEAIYDMFDTGVQDEMPGLLYQANKEVYMSVNTPYGQTNRQTMSSVVLQGDTRGTSFASVQVDKIGKGPRRPGSPTGTRRPSPWACWAWWTT